MRCSSTYSSFLGTTPSDQQASQIVGGHQVPGVDQVPVRCSRGRSCRHARRQLLVHAPGLHVTWGQRGDPGAGESPHGMGRAPCSLRDGDLAAAPPHTPCWPLPCCPRAREKRPGTRRECVWKMPGFIRPMFKLTVSYKCTRSRASTWACAPTVSLLRVSVQHTLRQDARSPRRGDEGSRRRPRPSPSFKPPRCHRSCVGRRVGERSPAQCAGERSWPCQRSPVQDTCASALHGAAGSGGESEGS